MTEKIYFSTCLVTNTHWHPITWNASWGWWLWPWCPLWWIWFAMFSRFWIQQILLRTDKYNTESSFPFYRRTNVVHMTQKSLGASRLTDRTSFKIDFLELKYLLQTYTFSTCLFMWQQNIDISNYLKLILGLVTVVVMSTLVNLICDVLNLIKII